MDDRLYKVIMRCGHSANSTKQIAVDDEIPYCVICDCDEVYMDIESFASQGRKAKCFYCDKIEDSRPTLAFYKLRPDKPYDEYYCGCEGWD